MLHFHTLSQQRTSPCLVWNTFSWLLLPQRVRYSTLSAVRGPTDINVMAFSLQTKAFLFKAPQALGLALHILVLLSAGSYVTVLFVPSRGTWKENCRSNRPACFQKGRSHHKWATSGFQSGVKVNHEMFFVIVKDRPHAECEVPEAVISMQCIFNTFYYSGCISTCFLPHRPSEGLIKSAHRAGSLRSAGWRVNGKLMKGWERQWNDYKHFDSQKPSTRARELCMWMTGNADDEVEEEAGKSQTKELPVTSLCTDLPQCRPMASFLFSSGLPLGSLPWPPTKPLIYSFCLLH